MDDESGVDKSPLPSIKEVKSKLWGNEERDKDEEEGIRRRPKQQQRSVSTSELCEGKQQGIRRRLKQQQRSASTSELCEGKQQPGTSQNHGNPSEDKSHWHYVMTVKQICERGYQMITDFFQRFVQQQEQEPEGMTVGEKINRFEKQKSVDFETPEGPSSRQSVKHPKKQMDSFVQRKGSRRGAQKQQEREETTDHADVGIPVVETPVMIGEYSTLPRKKKSRHSQLVPRPHVGWVLIVNINKTEGMQKRSGSTQDSKRMEKLFKDFFKYTVISHEDLNAETFHEAITEFISKAEKNQATCVIVVLMAHGGSNAGRHFIFLSDGSRFCVREEIEYLFSSRKAPYLAIVPKVFIIQSCQGGKADYGHPVENLYKEDSDSSAPMKDLGEERKASFRQYLFANASQQGRPATRTAHVGSIYIQTIEKVFKERAETHDIVELFSEVRKTVEENPSQGGHIQFPETINGLIQPLYLLGRKETFQ